MIFDLDDLPLEQKKSIQEFQKLLAMGQAESAAVATHVILYKSLGLFKNSAIACMSELYRRRALGEEYDFENFIDTEVNKLPKVQPMDFNMIQGLMNIKQLTGFLSKGSA